MNVSKSGVDLIKQSEKFMPNMYYDPVGLPTIGYGYYLNTPHLVAEYEFRTLSEKEASQLLQEHVDREVIPAIEAHITAKLNQNQIDSLSSFIYNVGRGNFSTSTLVRKINEGASEDEIREQFSRWNKGRVDGVLTVLNGLTTRRKEEADLYFKMPLKKKFSLHYCQR